MVEDESCHHHDEFCGFAKHLIIAEGKAHIVEDESC